MHKPVTPTSNIPDCSCMQCNAWQILQLMTEGLKDQQGKKFTLIHLPVKSIRFIFRLHNAGNKFLSSFRINMNTVIVCAGDLVWSCWCIAFSEWYKVHSNVTCSSQKSQIMWWVMSADLIRIHREMNDLFVKEWNKVKKCYDLIKLTQWGMHLKSHACQYFLSIRM